MTVDEFIVTSSHKQSSQTKEDSGRQKHSQNKSVWTQRTSSNQNKTKNFLGDWSYLVMMKFVAVRNKQERMNDTTD